MGQMELNDRLNALLMMLLRHGRPSLIKLEDGWWCRVELEGFSRGTSFAVNSDMDHTNPIEAVLQCIDRVEGTLATIKATA